ncbi:MAG TPA: hypothetical protein VNM15_05545 [Candidatus Binatia bacterium]|jgi:hypothetical protein|nr:hypothetical protein [Candidatus Binatia bacterium]
MKPLFLMALVVGVCGLIHSSVFAQAFGEYGRAVGSVPHGKGITGSPVPGGGKQGGKSGGGVGDVGGRRIPSRLVVGSNGAGLYQRQDEESQKLAQLARGEILTPMVQSAGANEWYMVKTESGMIGWVKSGDVHEEKAKK